MSERLLMRRGELKDHLRGPYLVTVDRDGFDQLLSLPFNVEFSVEIKQPRSHKHHRLFFAMLNLVFENQSTYATIPGMLDAIKIAIGHSDERIAVTGTKFYVPRSISFASMDQQEFRQFYEKAVNVILNHILPHTHKLDLEEQIYLMLGEAGPSSLTR